MYCISSVFLINKTHYNWTSTSQNDSIILKIILSYIFPRFGVTLLLYHFMANEAGLPVPRNSVCTEGSRNESLALGIQTVRFHFIFIIS